MKMREVWRGLRETWQSLSLPEPFRTVAIGLLLMALVALLGVLR